MKILHVLSTFTVDYPGGITNYVRTLAAAQVSDGDHVDVLDGGGLTLWQQHDGGFRVGSLRATNHRVHVVSSHSRAAETQEFFALLDRERYDVVHFHLTIGMGETMYEGMQRVGIPYVVSLHDYYLFCPRITMMDASARNCGGPEQRKCERCIGVLDQIDPLYRISRKSGIRLPRVLPSHGVTRRNEKIDVFLRHARTVLAVSARVRDFFVARYPDITVEVAHIGTASARAQPLPKVASDKIRITFLGTLSRHKGGEVFAELVERVTRDDVEFIFWGRALDTGLDTRLRDLGVQMKGSYTGADLPAIMATTDLGAVLPIWEDNAPQVVMEFLNHGVPVLGTRMGGIPDFVDAANGFLFPPTPDGIAAAAAFIDGVRPATLARLRAAIVPLTTPDEHRATVAAAYVGS